MHILIIFFLLLSNSILPAGVDITQLLPLAYCTSIPKSGADLDQAYTQFNTAYQYIQTLVTAEQTATTQEILASIGSEKAAMDTAYTTATKTDQSAPEYLLVVAKAIYDMFISLLKINVAALLPDDAQIFNVAAIEPQIDQTYQQTLSDIKGISGPGLTMAINRTISSIKAVVCAKAAAIERALKYKAFKETQQQALEQYQKDLQQRYDYYAKYKTFLQDASSYFALYLSVANQSQNFIKSFAQNKVYDQATVTKITNDYISLLSKFQQAYQKAGLKSGTSDLANYVTNVVRSLARFYNQLIFIQINFYKTSKNDTSILQALAQRIVGTGLSADPDLIKLGYDGILASVSANYLGGSSVIFNDYVQQKYNAIWTIFLAELNRMANLLAIDDQQLSYAQYVFTTVNNMIKYLPGDQLASIVNVNVSIAGIYAMRSQTILSKEMTTDLDANKKLLTQVITNFTNAATHYGIAGGQVASLKDIYQKKAGMLSQAQADFAQAQQLITGGSIDQALPLLTKAGQGFAAGGDIVDGNLVKTQLVQLAGQQYLQQGKKILDTYADTYKNKWQAYINYINTADSSGSLDNFDELFTALIAACQQARAIFVQAQQNYKQLAEDPAVAKDATYQQNVALLDGALDVLNGIMQAQGLISKADGAAGFKTSDLLSQAQQQYKAALAQYQKIDEFLQQATLASFVTISPSNLIIDKSVTWTFALVTIRRIAKLFLTIVPQIDDPSLKLLYLSFVKQNYIAQLSATIANAFEQQITALSKNIEAINTLVAKAQDDEKKALAFSASDWAIAQNVQLYQSNANALWQQVLQEYWSAYQLGKQDVLTDYMKAIDEYTAAYKQHVAAEFYPNAGLALIYYAPYIIYQSMNDTQHSSQMLAQIESQVESFFATGQQLLDSFTKALQGDANALQTSSDTYASLLRWLSYADQLVSQQLQVIVQVGQQLSQTQKQTLLLVAKTTDHTGTVIYTYLPTKRTVIVPDPAITYAQVSHKAGDYFYSKGDYNNAKNHYKDTWTIYYKKGLPVSKDLQKQYWLARARYDGYSYLNNIIQQNLVTLGKITQVPAHYLLQIYQQPLPEEVLNFVLGILGKNITDLPNFTPQQIADFYVDLAQVLFLYHKIAYNFSADQFQTYYNIIKQGNVDGLSDADKQKVVAIANDFNNYVADLKKRIAEKDTKKATLLTLKGDHPPYQNACSGISSPYALIETNAPAPVYLEAPYENFYPCYPTVLNYYTIGMQLLDSVENLVIAGITYAFAGYDPQGHQKAQLDRYKAYLSQGNSYQAAIDAINAIKEVKGLASVAKDNMQINLQDYKQYYQELATLFERMISFYTIPLTQLKQESIEIPNKDMFIANLNDLIGKTFKSYGDNLKQFLVGNPQDDANLYNDLLNKISLQYFTAIITYNYATTLWNELAALWENAGDIVAKQSNFFGAVYYYAGAQFYFEKFAGQQKTSADIIRIKNKQVIAYFNGSSYLMQQYNNYKTKPISIKLKSSGQTKTFTFQQIVTIYYAWSQGKIMPDSDEAVLDMAGTIKAAILDALIYYSGSSNLLIQYASQNMQGTIKEAAAADQQGQSDNQSLTPQEQAGRDMIKTFTNNNKIDLNTATGAQALLDRNDFPAIIIDEFAKLANNVATAADDNTRSINYQAMGFFAKILYDAFSKLYINDFYNFLDPVSATQTLMQDIETEIQNIKVPQEQYIGQ